MLKERKVLLISGDVSSLVVDAICEQAVGRNATVAYFYFDFAAHNAQSPAEILVSILQQVIAGLDLVPETIVKAFRDRSKVSSHSRLAPSEIVEFLHDISSSRHTYICMDALDECREKQRVELLYSLDQILRGSPSTRIFLTGRPHTRTEVENYFVGRLATISITPTEGDIIIFLRAKLGKDTMPDAMDESLEEEIIRGILRTVSDR